MQENIARQFKKTSGFNSFYDATFTLSNNGNIEIEHGLGAVPVGYYVIDQIVTVSPPEIYSLSRTTWNEKTISFFLATVNTSSSKIQFKVRIFI